MEREAIIQAVKKCDADTAMADAFRKAAGIRFRRKRRRRHRKISADAEEDYARLMAQRLGALDRDALPE